MLETEEFRRKTFFESDICLTILAQQFSNRIKKELIVEATSDFL